jgi:peptidoglycan/LPS O-acetylase OafA/YrhL
VKNEPNLLAAGGAEALAGRAASAGAEAAPAVSTAPAKGAGFHIPSLDGIRALSFLLVFVAHAGLGSYVPGGFGVTIFFFLSGYLITTLLRQEYDKTSTISFRGFYLRRTLRIFPPFYLVLLVAVLLTMSGALQAALSAPAVLAQAAYLGNYYAVLNDFVGIAPGTAIFWSLAVEEHFYLVFPLVYLLLRRRVAAPGRQALILAATCAAVLIWRCALVYGMGQPDLRTYVATDTRIDSILFGCILAIYGNPMFDTSRFSRRAWLLGLAPLGLALLAFTLAFRDEQFRETFRYTLQGIALIPIFVVAVRYPQIWPFSWLNLRWVRFMGTLSYSLYLVHQVYLFLLEQHTGLPALAQAIIALGLSVLTATAIYYSLELPLARMRRRMLKAA